MGACHQLVMDSEPAEIDPDLANLIATWSTLSSATRETIAMLIRAEFGRLVEKPSTN